MAKRLIPHKLHDRLIKRRRDRFAVTRPVRYPDSEDGWSINRQHLYILVSTTESWRTGSLCKSCALTIHLDGPKEVSPSRANILDRICVGHVYMDSA